MSHSSYMLIVILMRLVLPVFYDLHRKLRVAMRASIITITGVAEPIDTRKDDIFELYGPIGFFNNERIRESIVYHRSKVFI